MKKLAAFFILNIIISFAFATNQNQTNTNNTEATAKYLKSIQNDPTRLQQFFYVMPKGGDLHVHIDGAVYAEDLINFGAKQGFCINPKDFEAYKNPNCPQEYQLKNIPYNPPLYRKVIDTRSMRYFPLNFKPGLPQFFSTFLRMQAVLDANVPEAIASIVNRAGRQNESYIELMIGNSMLHVSDSKGQTPMQIGSKTPMQKDLNAWRKALLEHGLNEVIDKTKEKVITVNDKARELMKCGTKNAEPGCHVTIRYQYYTLRILPPQQYYAQLVTAFAVANSSKLVTAINIVMPENWTQSLQYYTQQMKMIGFLRTIYPKAHVTLHAGELAFGQLPPRYLLNHVDQAVNIAHADRIGHGVDIPYEQNSQKLLNEMVKKHIDVEINLTSNKDVLGVSGKDHPLPLYVANHVPVTLSTDDEGIERTDLTAQYKIAELDYGFSYQILKNIARNSLTYGFVQGKPLWQGYDYQNVAPECANQAIGNTNPTPECQAFLNANLKAKLQWQLEHKFQIFEAKIAKGSRTPHS